MWSKSLQRLFRNSNFRLLRMQLRLLMNWQRESLNSCTAVQGV